MFYHPPTPPNSTLPFNTLLIILNDRGNGGNNHRLTPFNDCAPLRLTHAEPIHFGPAMGLHRFGCDKLDPTRAASRKCECHPSTPVYQNDSWFNNDEPFWTCVVCGGER